MDIKELEPYQARIDNLIKSYELKVQDFAKETRRNYTLRMVLGTVREHIRLTREYVGEDVLPEIDGWSWYEAIKLIDKALADES